MNKYPNDDIETIKNKLNDEIKKINKYLFDIEHSPIIVLPNLKSCVNTGSILRICGATAFSNEIVLIGQRKYAKNLCIGAHHYLNINTIINRNDDYPKSEHHDIEHQNLDWDIIKKYLIEKSAEHIIIFVEQWETSISIFNMHNKIREIYDKSNSKYKIIFVMGHENFGIPNFLKDVPNSFSIYIPQLGVINSMNVSMAFNILAHEYVRPYLSNN